MMKKTLLVLLVVLVILATLSISAYAKPATDVSGTLDYWFEISSTRAANGNTFLYATEHEHWAGDLAGAGDSVFRVGMFASGFWNVWLRCEFTGTALGDKEGTLVIQMVGKKPSDGGWYGQWVILSGTGDLANAHGRGTWWGPGYRSDVKDPEDPDIFYTGKVHLAP